MKKILVGIIFLMFVSAAFAADKPAGGYAELDGSADRFVHTSEVIGAWDEGSVSMWVRIDDFGKDNQLVYESCHLDGSSFQIRVDGSSLKGYLFNDEWGSYTLPSTGVWYNIVMTWKKSGASYSRKFYVNNVEQVSDTSAFTPAASSGLDLYIGGAGNSAGGCAYNYDHQSLDGAIDEVMIYNRELSSTEVDSIYDRGVLGRKSNIDTNLVAYYDFENLATTDNTAIDDKEASYDLSAEADAYTVEHIGGIGVFDSSDYVTVTHTTDYELTSGSFTVEFWVNFQSSPSTNQVLFGQEDGSNPFHGWSVVQDGSSNTIGFYVDGAGHHAQSFTPTLGQWYHIMYTRDASNGYWYIDGTQYSISSLYYPSAGSNNFYIGKSDIGSWGSNFDGFLDEIKIYKGKMFSASEAADAYNNGLKGFKSDVSTGLVGHYSMDTNFNDDAGNGNHGTANGAISSGYGYKPYHYSPFGEFTQSGFEMYEPDNDKLPSRTEEDTWEIRDDTATTTYAEVYPDKADSKLDNMILTLAESTVHISNWLLVEGMLDRAKLIMADFGQGGVYCPTAISEVQASCTGGVAFSDIECQTSTTKTAAGGEQVTCDKGSLEIVIIGILVDQYGIEPFLGIPPVPEFSNVGVLLAIIIITAGGIFIARRRD